MDQKTYNREEVVRTLNLFVGKGNIAEIRILNAFGSKNRSDSGYFNNFEQAAGCLKSYGESPKNPGIYFVLNPFSSELMARAANRIHERATDTTQDSDITRRIWLFIDCDPKRKTGISSTDEEWERSKNKAKQVANWLIDDMGFPEPVIATSGNGFHLHFRIDIPADDASRNLVKSFLRAIAAKFDDDSVTIDTKVFNAARICKLYGTMARKGDSTTERPHRMSRLLHVPSELVTVQMDQLQKIASMAPAEKKPAAKNSSGKKTGIHAVDRCRAYLQKVPGAIAGASGHDWTYHAACVAVIDFDLSIDDALPLLQEWNEKCEPPWSESDLMHKLESVDKLPDERGKALQTDRQKWEAEQELIIRTKSAGSPEPAVELDPLAYDRKILADCGITYVAQHDSTGQIEIFSEVTQKFTMIKDPAGIKYEQLVLAGGHRIRQMIARNMDDSGTYSLNEVKLAIASIAAQTSVVEDKLGVGVWENNGSLIVVNARRLGMINGVPELQITSSPVQYGTAYDIGDRCDWINLEQLRDEVASVQMEPGKLHVPDVEGLRNLFGNWRFLQPINVFPEVLAGMVLATYVQTLWHWRPQIFLTGQAYAGKSTMFKMISRIFGPLCKMSSNSSAAGLRQFLACSGRIVLCDELEKSRHRKEILEMIRASGRGDESFRGTASHQHMGFRLQHIFWCASIESGLQSEADQSRFIVAELRKVDKKIDLPSPEELEAMGRRLAAVAIVNFRAARQLTERLLDNRPKEVHGRICESYAVPCAMYATSVGMSWEESITLYQSALGAIGEGEDIESDSDALLQEIMLAKIRVSNYERQVMEMVMTPSGYEMELRNNGVYVTQDEILLNRRSVSKILSNEWKEKRIDTLLMRIDGARRVVKRFGKSTMRFIAIPRSAVSEIEIENREPRFEDQAKADIFQW